MSAGQAASWVLGGEDAYSAGKVTLLGISEYKIVP